MRRPHEEMPGIDRTVQPMEPIFETDDKKRKYEMVALTMKSEPDYYFSALAPHAPTVIALIDGAFNKLFETDLAKGLIV
jgi:hypothetical protein